MKQLLGFLRNSSILGVFLCSWQVVGIDFNEPFLKEKPIVVITASYNNQDWYERNLSSIFAQNYSNYRIIYIDDNSTDETADLVAAFVHNHAQEERFTLIRNTERHGHLYNQYHAIHMCSNNAIIIIVDGDDWLAHDGVFDRVNREYHAGAWLTFGQFWYWKKDHIGICREIPLDVLVNGQIRLYKPWRTSHLRTFYAGLFKQIPREDLLFEGNFYPMCADVVTMMAMIDMARSHVHFISDILYIYNDANTLCFYHDKREQQIMLENEIRSKKPYEALEQPPYLE